MTRSITRRGFFASANAVLAGMFLSKTSSAATKDVPWLSEVRRSPVAAATTGEALEPLLVAEDGTPIESLDQWLRQREVIRDRWDQFLGTMPERPRVRREVLREETLPGVRRLLIRYECEPGIPVEGYLLYPHPVGTTPRAGLVALHPTTADTIDEIAGVSGPETKALGLQLAREGFVVFCPRCFLWQDPALDYEEAARRFLERRPGVLGIRKMLYDAQCAVDVLTSLPEVDPNRIGAVGHSLGAKETLYLAAFDERIQAAVASEGGIGLTFTNWHDPWYLGPAIHKPGFSLNHHQLLALIAPRPFLILGGESGGPAGSTTVDGDRTWPYVDAALPVYELYGKPARIGLYNHRQGHTIPPDAYHRTAEWLRTYLGAQD